MYTITKMHFTKQYLMHTFTSRTQKVAASNTFMSCFFTISTRFAN